MPKRRRGSGCHAADKAAEREQEDGDTATPAARRSMVDVITIGSSSPVCGVSDIEDNTAAPAVAPKKRRGRLRLAADKAAE